MSPTLRRTIAATAVILTLAAAACGGDDDDDTAADGATDTTEAAADAAAAGTDAYCAASLAIEVAPGPEIDFASASEEEIGTAMQAWMNDTMLPLVDDIEAVVPAEIEEDGNTLITTIRTAAETGDLSGLEGPELAEANAAVHTYDLDTCGWTEQAVEAADYSFDGIPDEMDAGPVSFELTNGGQEVHEMIVAKINDDVTEPLEELIALPEEEAMSKIVFQGEPVAVAPGDSDFKVVDLEPGRYGVVCFIPMGMTSFEEGPPSPDAPPHAMQGMYAELTVN
jgi:uncharacterized cupredoxin-like copper-binding protein